MAAPPRAPAARSAGTRAGVTPADGVHGHATPPPPPRRARRRPSARSSLPGVAKTGPSSTKSAPSPSARRAASTEWQEAPTVRDGKARCTSRHGQAVLRELDAVPRPPRGRRRDGRSRARASAVPAARPCTARHQRAQGRSREVLLAHLDQVHAGPRGGGRARTRAASRPHRPPAVASPSSGRSRRRAARSAARARALRCWWASCTASTMFTSPRPVTVPRVNGLSTSDAQRRVGLEQVVRVPERRPGHDGEDDAHQQRAERRRGATATELVARLAPHYPGPPPGARAPSSATSRKLASWP